MKKAAVATTAARGTAVSRSRITAVQSVYIAADENRHHHPSQGPRRAILGAIVMAALALPLLPNRPLLAGVQFDDCQPTPEGGVTCDTQPTGNTRLDAIDARFGLFNEASPGWKEFAPFEGDDDLFGGNET